MVRDVVVANHLFIFLEERTWLFVNALGGGVYHSYTGVSTAFYQSLAQLSARLGKKWLDSKSDIVELRASAGRPG